MEWNSPNNSCPILPSCSLCSSFSKASGDGTERRHAYLINLCIGVFCKQVSPPTDFDVDRPTDLESAPSKPPSGVHITHTPL